MVIANHTLPKLHWRFPENAKFGRVIPKEKLYSHAGVNTPLKQLFIEQVGQIKWVYKLAETTINLAKTEQIDEIEVIQIKLKTNILDQQVLGAIDKAIPHPTLFILVREQQGEIAIAYIAAHKQKAATEKKGATKEKWQQSQYLQSEWVTTASQTAQPLPAATNLGQLYQQLLEALIPVDITNIKNRPEQQSLEEKLAVIEKIELLKKHIVQIKAKRDKEKQFNRKRELNDQFKSLKKQLAELTD